MGRSIEVWVPGVPRPQGSKKHVGRGRMVESSPYLAAWRETVGVLVGREWWDDPSDRPITLGLRFEFGLPKRVRDGREPGDPHCAKPDLDKLIRAIGDALSGIVWADDSQIVSTYATKLWCHPNAGGVTVTIDEWGDPDLSAADAEYLDADMEAVRRAAAALRELAAIDPALADEFRTGAAHLTTDELHRFAAATEAHTVAVRGDA